MKRTQIQLDEQTYQLLRTKAFERGVSIARVVREAVQQYVVGAPAMQPRIEDFTFIGSGHSSEFEPEPGSAEWGDIIYEEIQEKVEEYRKQVEASDK